MKFNSCGRCADKQTGKGAVKEVILENQLKLEKVTSFPYLGDKVQANGGAHLAVRNRIRAAWAKWREVAPLLLKKEIAIKNRAIAYKIYIRSTLIYGSETWALTESDKGALNRTELRMLRWMMGGASYGKTEKEIRVATNVTSILDIVRQQRLKWFGHVTRMKDECWIKGCLTMVVEGKRERGRPAIRWLDLVNKDLKEERISTEATKDRVKWRYVTRAKRPNSSN